LTEFRGSICLAHIRFRSAIKAQKDRGELRLEDLPYHAILGVAGSWIGFLLALICIAATIYTAIGVGGEFHPVDFFQEILALPIVIFFYVLWKIWKRTAIVKASEADLVSGRREVNLQEEKAKEQAEMQNWSTIKRYPPSFACLLIAQSLPILLLEQL